MILNLNKRFLLLICVFFQITTSLSRPKTQSVLQENPTQGWPDMFWLRNLQARVESIIKDTISTISRKQSPGQATELTTPIKEAFEVKLKVLSGIADQLEHSSFECLALFDEESRGLQDWLTSLSQQLEKIRQQIIDMVNSHYYNSVNKYQWIDTSHKMLIETRRLFEMLFFCLSERWQGLVPELLYYQTSFDHTQFMDAETIIEVDLKEFLTNLPDWQKKIDWLLAQDFRNATNPESRAARQGFYDLSVKMSRMLRGLDIGTLSALSNEAYKQIVTLVETIGKTVISRQPQLKYDQTTYNDFVKTQIWMLFYWFYNVFPYKNFPWPDENMLSIETFFVDVSGALNLGSPFTFKFNHKNRHRFKLSADLKKKIANPRN